MRRELPKNAVLIPEKAKRVFQGKIFDVYQWEQELFDGSTTIFEMLRRPDAVYVIAIDGDKIITMDEEQPNGIKRLADLPGGRVDETDASVLDAAKREMEEETGFQYANWHLFSVTQPFWKIEWFIHTFIATDKIGEVPLRHDAGEKITVTHSDFVTVKEKHAHNIEALRNYDNLEQLLNLRTKR